MSDKSMENETIETVETIYEDPKNEKPNSRLKKVFLYIITTAALFAALFGVGFIVGKFFKFFAG